MSLPCPSLLKKGFSTLWIQLSRTLWNPRVDGLPVGVAGENVSEAAATQSHSFRR